MSSANCGNGKTEVTDDQVDAILSKIAESHADLQLSLLSLKYGNLSSITGLTLAQAVCKLSYVNLRNMELTAEQATSLLTLL